MDYYGQSSVATVPTGRSPTWYEAVNSEFFYEQDQIKKMNSNNQHGYANSTTAATTATNHSINVHEQPLTNVEHQHHLQQQQPPQQPPPQQQQIAHINNSSSNNNGGFYHRPMSMQFSNDANNYFPPPPSSYAGDGSTTLSYPPCQGPRPWNFAQCYGFYGQPACSMLNIIDMEDFMWVSFHKCNLRRCVSVSVALSLSVCARVDLCVTYMHLQCAFTANEERRSCAFTIKQLIERRILCLCIRRLLRFWINQEIRIRAKRFH